MSSGVRTLQKRLLRKFGFVRQTSRIANVAGVPTVIPFRKGEGPILAPNGARIGRHYPKLMPPMRGDGTPKRKGAPRGSRRGKVRKGFSVASLRKAA